MVPLPRIEKIEKIEKINILTKEGNANLDIFLKTFYKIKDQKQLYKQLLYQPLIFNKPC